MENFSQNFKNIYKVLSDSNHVFLKFTKKILHVFFPSTNKIITSLPPLTLFFIFFSGLAKVTADELKPASLLCNYIIYSFIGLDSDKYKIKSLDEELDTEKGKNNFRAVTNLKLVNPSLKVLVSVGGFWDDDEPEKYLKMVLIKFF